ncbi:tigger transposable element-derived protein 1-like [Hemiscyllium ocellatum]|uniref:tigger transposable element-derived protein 1-like n=1 Tax=Hemiscyllium ocellatum TaxID=170820 RepID=UPI002965E7C9|nr:tigger transposable element-derived protein 1-like [Hemiscyllium ocellatum]
MAPMKVKSGRVSGVKKPKCITVEMKKEIIAKHKNGARVSDLAMQYDMAKLTICTILKNKEALKAADVAKGVTILTKQRPKLLDEVEKLLLVWINQKELAGDSVNETIICEKALHIHHDLLATPPSTSTASIEEFKASIGRFDKFRPRTGIHSVIRHGEAASSDKKAAEDFVKEFNKFVEDEGDASHQVFKCDETGRFWKKIPKRTYITQEDKALLGHKSMKDRLTLLLCANANGDCKIKPLLVYHSENPRILKLNNVLKAKFPVMWRANSKAWVTRMIFMEWLTEVFAPAVKEYLETNNLPLKCLLLMDNAPAHPPNLEEELDLEYGFIKVFQVTNDTDLTFGQYWKDHFNILHCISLIDKAWNEISFRTLQSAWRELWPDWVPERDFEGFEEETSVNVVNKIATLGQNMGLDVDEDDVMELVEDHRQELSMEDLVELQQEQVKVMQQEHSGEEEEEKEDVSSVQIKDICSKWSEVQAFVERHHPNKTVTNRAVNILNDNVMSHFQKILQQRKKQVSLDRFLVASPTSKRQKREKTPEIAEQWEN